ncbi:MAG TPA: glycosyltransferase [Puia sp.]|nr:glycosyltransferase [Puia sp.]
MRILLDARPLQHAGPESERSRLIATAFRDLAAGAVFGLAEGATAGASGGVAGSGGASGGVAGEGSVGVAGGVAGEGSGEAAGGASGRATGRASGASDAADEVEWIVVADQRYRAGNFPRLPGTVIVRRAIPGKAGWSWWYDRTIPRLARRLQADLLVLTGGIAAAECGIRQCIWMPGRAEPAFQSPDTVHPLYRGRLAASLARASAVFCFSEADRELLAGSAPASAGKIRVLRAFPGDGIRPLSGEEKTAVRSQRTGGKEFFFADLTGAGEEDLVYLLKAFSLFKKRQLSQMRLVLDGRIDDAPAARERLRSYKYKNDIDWAAGAAAGRDALAGAAYAAVFPFEGDHLGVPLVNAWKAGVPAIVTGGGILEEMAGNPGGGMDRSDPAVLAAQLMRIYKEEQLREELIGRGFGRLGEFSRERFVDAVRSGFTGAPGEAVQ